MIFFLFHSSALPHSQTVSYLSTSLKESAHSPLLVLESGNGSDEVVEILLAIQYFRDGLRK